MAKLITDVVLKDGTEGYVTDEGVSSKNSALNTEE